MKEKICTVSVGNGFLDDDYIFYENGEIKRFYDQNRFKYNLEEWVTSNQISENKKQKLLSKCPEVYREEVYHILYIN